jgi:hypothetical protein
MMRCGATTIVLCVLLAGQSRAHSASGVSAALDLQRLSVTGTQVSASPRSSPIPVGIDVGAVGIHPAFDIYSRFGDAIFPGCVVKNSGTEKQTDIPVICTFYDSATGACVYGPETAYVASLDTGAADTVGFPSWVPPLEEKVYFDTMATALAGDQDTANDWTYGRLIVSDWGQGHLSYNDGTFEGSVTWVMGGGEWAERIAAPKRPLTLYKAAVWLTDKYWHDTAYAAEVRVYGIADSPPGFPGTQLGVWRGHVHTDTWPFLRRTEVYFDPPIVIDRDTFFVSCYQTGSNNPYIGLDLVGNSGHWGAWSGHGGSWRAPDSIYDFNMDYGIDVYYEVSDAAVDGIEVPPGRIDSNTTFKPQIVVKNAGTSDISDIPTVFYITWLSAAGDTIYVDTANSGVVGAGQTEVVTFASSIAPAPGRYMMTAIALLPDDVRPDNDTLVKPLFVAGSREVVASDVVPDTAFVLIVPDPLRAFATVLYGLPEAGPISLMVYDAEGQKVLSRTIAAERFGTTELDLRQLSAGVYITRIKTESFSRTQKLVVGR